jgi:hypothetical protein
MDENIIINYALLILIAGQAYFSAREKGSKSNDVLHLVLQYLAPGVFGEPPKEGVTRPPVPIDVKVDRLADRVENITQAMGQINRDIGEIRITISNLLPEILERRIGMFAEGEEPSSQNQTDTDIVDV